MRKILIIEKLIQTFNFLTYYRFVILIPVLLLFKVTYGQEVVLLSEKTGTKVTGIVRDAITKEPVAAAQIKALNNEAAAVTNENGAFSIILSSLNEVLFIKAFEYNQVEFPVRGITNLEIELFANQYSEFYNQVDDISGVTRSTTSPRAINQLKKFDNSSIISVDDAIQSNLQGDVRGISRSGVNGLGSSIFIRGLNSINLNAQPLYVVDGVIWNNFMDYTSLHDGYYSNPLASIDLNDIENVSVIKDGTSLFGSKGSNGVIYIKTKRGKDMATKITLNALVGTTAMPQNFPVMNGDEFRLYVTDLHGTTGPTLSEINDIKYLNDDPTSITYKKYHNSTNWEDEIYQKGTLQNYNISVNGGDERALYAFSLGYTGIKGIVQSTDLKRLNTRFNADFSLSKKVSMAMNIGFTNNDRNLFDDGVNFYTSPTFLSLIKAQYLNPYTYTTSGTLTDDFEDADDFNVGNPNAIIENSLNFSKQYRLNLTLNPKFQLLPSLTLSSLFDYSLYKVKESFYKPIVGSADEIILGLGVSENVFKNQVLRENAFFNDTRLEHNYKISDFHKLNSILGYRLMVNYCNSDYAEGHNSGSDQIRYLLTSEEFKYLSGLNNQTKSISYYANFDYSFDNRYFITTTVSVDGSSRFGNQTMDGLQMFNNSWGIFPSVNIAWLVSSENFMANLPFIDMLKLRSGFGITGNDAIEPYANEAYFSPTRFIDRANGLYLSNIGNSEIQWETAQKTNFGVDMNLLKNRLSVSVDVYNNTIDDLLHLKELPEVVGEGYYWTNGGSMSNKGFEINTQVKVIAKKRLKWEMGAAIGHYSNKIKSLPDGNTTTTIYNAEILTSVDNPAGVFYGYKTKGVFTTQAQATEANLKMIDEDGNLLNFTSGDIFFDDITNDGYIDENDKQIIGDPNPDFYGAFTNKIIFDNFTIDALFTFSYGNDIYNYLRSELESGRDFMNQTTAMLNRWSYDGQETDIPKVYYGDPMGNARFSDRWIEDGSYLRLKSLSVT
ncbi:MAG: SusC/RagA family TonB-linked outer membrane protein, partial [Salinivirgaceae bacterium]|nr:SusC/RagA family TonB-linked outer membrane protein [Salinivirgaceae bacterium]